MPVTLPAQRHSRRRPHEAAFSLLEMAIVIAIAGLALYATAMVIPTVVTYSRFHATKLNMQKIEMVLSAYAQQNNRIPCPADPDTSDTIQPMGYEVGSGATGAVVPDVLGNAASGGCTKGGVTFNEGIVPYATLGIARADVRDGWGNYITYHVDPTYATDPSPQAATISAVHARCRVPGTWVTGSSGSVGGTYSRNYEKAVFCCPYYYFSQNGYDITVKDQNGKNLWDYPRDTTASHYDLPNKPTTMTSFDPATTNVEGIAFVLVSHGPTGEGAFLSTGGRIPVDANAGPGELENLNGDNTFVDAPWSTASGKRFRNVVLWMTQDQLYAALGHSSCQIP